MRHLRSILISIIACIIALSSLPAFVSAQTSYPAWAPNVAYKIGDQVTYQDSTHPNHLYKCQQAHTSQVGWEPPATPALWIDEGAYGGGSVTNTPTSGPTSTPKPTNTGAPTATSSGSGGTCAPAYVNGNVYVGGNVVSYQGHNWLAKWWTQNEYPSTGGSGVWQDNGPCSTGPTNTPTRTPTTGPSATPTATSSGSGGGLRIMGYFADWDVYGRAYFPKNMVTSGMIAKMNYLIFAFGNVTNASCAIGDAYADTQMNYTAANSVSGVADPTDGSITTGIIHQFQEIKALYPNLKIIWSFGGWTWSGGFGAAAANAASFASSCYNLVHDPRWNGTFSGIDIDWEYPNSCGLSCDSSGFSSYPTLMSALRSRFGSDLVTAAITADGTSGGKMDAADYGGAVQYLDWYNLMTYDYFGAWASTGPTAPHSPLYSYSGIPTAGFYADAAVQKLKSKNVPSSKINLGIGFYGRGWTGVTQSAPGGSATGAATGTYEAGIEDYHVLMSTCPATNTVAGTAYALCGNNWWSYDTPSTIAGKMSYSKSQGLGGAFFWEAFGDTSSGTLTAAMYNNR
ncbi:MAG TPA: glycosyl hydrolase family 18 protein [Aggregatilineales bacterium]|nr:glycosyl hydrolase family 18 protein [Aggregatilineales bacterium]